MDRLPLPPHSHLADRPRSAARDRVKFLAAWLAGSQRFAVGSRLGLGAASAFCPDPQPRRWRLEIRRRARSFSWSEQSPDCAVSWDSGEWSDGPDYGHPEKTRTRDRPQPGAHVSGCPDYPLAQPRPDSG